MFVGAERGSSFLSQSTGCFIPGYTGHCPTLKFRFGKRYGANTKEIIQEMGERGAHLHRTSGEPYLHSLTAAVPLSIQRQQPLPSCPPQQHRVSESTSSHRDHNGATHDHTGRSDPHRSRRFILGYTGYIPGLNFRYGKSFERAADDSVAEFGRRLREQSERRERERSHRARSAPKTFSSRPREQVRASMREYEEKNRYKAYHQNSLPLLATLDTYQG
ncbi:protein FAM166B-like isoform X2 [Ischnura elegans]|uniref:protein FAM166B-like isoform X2 n=1 Tax=Ischnura elegans TaxID=197161 RepID=UPI001ED8AF0B|nr:protein FAM166B-like isoform X2 [Ischnura elegans]